mmetsp:Transcript_103238/g.126174  ORF Transcript_103238/g.126174 Transcript_103238/m.126174 type:complete len:86 (+) Transcript_103238:730-987(+)
MMKYWLLDLDDLVIPLVIDQVLDLKYVKLLEYHYVHYGWEKKRNQEHKISIYIYICIVLYFMCFIMIFFDDYLFELIKSFKVIIS